MSTLQRTGAALVCGLVLPLPIVLANPDFATTPFEWLELLGLATCVVFLATWIGGFLNRPSGIQTSPSRVVLAYLVIGIATASIGWIVLGIPGSLWASIILLGLPLGMRKASQKEPAAGVWVVLLSIMVLAAAGLATHTAVAYPDLSPPRQVVLIGLDGASEDIVDELVRRESLGRVQEIIETGSRASLDTLDPVLSPPIWTSIATGVSPDVHGVRDFWTSSRKVRAKRIWEIVDDHRLTSGVVGYLVTWPPTKENGFLVPGWLAQGPETVPPNLRFIKELELSEKSGGGRPLQSTIHLFLQALRHGLTLSTLNDSLAFLISRKLGMIDQLDQALRVRLLQAELRTDLFCHLQRRFQPAFSVLYLNSIDAIQHMFFKYFDPSGFPDVSQADISKYSSAIPMAYEQADHAIGRIQKASRSNAIIVVVSDHGQESARSEGEMWYTIRASSILEELELDGELRATVV